MLKLNEMTLPEDLALRLAEMELQFNRIHPDDPATLQEIAEMLLMRAIVRFSAEDLERG